jgi:hypothetical protein
MNADRIPVVGTPALSFRGGIISPSKRLIELLYYLFIRSVRENDIEEESDPS